MKKLIAILPLVAALSACGGPTGFNDPEKLAASVKDRLNTLATEKGFTQVAQAVTCIPSAAHSFDCHFDISDGTQSVTTYIVTADGSTWMAKAGQ